MNWLKQLYWKRRNEKKLSFSDDHTLMFWLPPSDDNTHVGITFGSGTLEIYINGIQQDQGKLREMGEWIGNISAQPTAIKKMGGN